MSKILILISFVALCAQPVTAQEVEDFLKCRQLTDSLERLRCYDDVVSGEHLDSATYVHVDKADAAGPPQIGPCPLRLEARLSRGEIENKRGWTTGRFGSWECESTRVSAFKVQAERRGGGVTVILTPWVQVRPSYDRLASLDFELLPATGTASYPARLGSLDAEEGQAVSDTVRIRLSADDYEALFGDGDAARLRLTLRVKDNR